MITDPWKYADCVPRRGRRSADVHIEVEQNGDVRELLEHIRARGALAGCPCSPTRPSSGLQPFVDRLDLVLVMSVFAGVGGQKSCHRAAEGS
jgi:ribulose-phosphate 3-epimerase